MEETNNGGFNTKKTDRINTTQLRSVLDVAGRLGVSREAATHHFLMGTLTTVWMDGPRRYTSAAELDHLAEVIQANPAPKDKRRALAAIRAEHCKAGV